MKQTRRNPQSSAHALYSRTPLFPFLPLRRTPTRTRCRHMSVDTLGLSNYRHNPYFLKSLRDSTRSRVDSSPVGGHCGGLLTPLWRRSRRTNSYRPRLPRCASRASVDPFTMVFIFWKPKFQLKTSSCKPPTVCVPSSSALPVHSVTFAHPLASHLGHLSPSLLLAFPHASPTLPHHRRPPGHCHCRHYRFHCHGLLLLRCRPHLLPHQARPRHQLMPPRHRLRRKSISPNPARRARRARRRRGARARHSLTHTHTSTRRTPHGRIPPRGSSTATLTTTSLRPPTWGQRWPPREGSKGTVTIS